ncbi:WD repeat-containing protein 47-like isoform X1 [Uloborus diversus]|uniref:WD repeat-containing protein 47-like isoform X1 n=1 Tax=Uloborus diversus TaxID=327109 RepID=UPI00240A51C6|nr:WD repeat-containing protein 47-like isoform X1 [Uloborus diversus]
MGTRYRKPSGSPEERMARKRIDSLFGDRTRYKYLVVCEGGLVLHDRPYSPEHDQFEIGKLSGSSQATGSSDSTTGDSKQNFVAVTQLEDEQAIRAVEFHPSGKFYAVGSNTKMLRICAYPNCKDIRPDHEPREPVVLYKRQKHHKGSIYCMAWNATGDLLATGSNDKTVKLLRFNSSSCQLEDIAHPLTMHGGTVRDMCFMEDISNRSNILISGGSGDNKIYITDCETAMPFQSLTGHTGQILSLYTWGGVMFVSSSQDKTIRFWDMRTRGCVNLIPARPAGGTGPGSAAATVSVDPSGRLLVSGHDDSSCMLYDMKGSRILQTFKPHTADVKTARLSPKAFYLLTGSYDCKLMLTDLQGDLTQPLATVRVAEHADKVIQGRWHPHEFTFLSTSADKTATLWALPQT